MAFNLDSISTKAVHKPPTMILVAKAKMGKALDIRTPILTAKGWSTMADIKPGDVVYDKDGKPTKVTRVTPIQLNRPCNIVRTLSGVEVTADDNHLWYTHSRNLSKVEVLNTKQIAESLVTDKGAYKHSIPVCSPVEFGNPVTDVDPYVVGYWLGDGCSTSGYVTISDRDSEIANHLGKLGKSHRDHGASFTVTVIGLKMVLEKYGMIGNKYIPGHFLWEADVQSRFSLLAGLMDSDGYIENTGKRQCEFTTTNETLANNVYSLLRSLGCKCCINVGRAILKGKNCGPKYRVQFAPHFNPFRWCGFKKNRYDNATSKMKGNKDAIVSVEHIDSVPVKCIEVDSPSHTYLAGRDLLVTHNTSFCAGDRVENGEIVEWGLNKPIILWLKGEQGASDIPVAKNTEAISSYDELMDALGWLATNEHGFETVTVDSLTTLCEIVREKVVAENPSLAEKMRYDQYGAGNKIAAVYHRKIADALTYLRDEKSMCAIVTAHIKHNPKDVADPEKGVYSAWMADIPDAIWGIYERSFDVCLYADTKDITTQVDIGMGNKQGKVVSLNNGERFLLTKKTLSHPSGGRGIYGHLPPEIPFHWAAFQEAIASTIEKLNNK